MENDLTLSKTDDVTDTELDEGGEVEFTTREEYILCSVNALGAVSEMNCLTAADSMRQKRIQRKCLRIIDSMVGEMYDELFDDSED